VWVARWRDALTGAETQQSLDALGLSTIEARRAWAIDKASSLKSTRAAVASGKAVATRTGLTKAVGNYVAGATAKAITLEGYRPHLDRFVAWTATVGVGDVQDLQPRHLAAYRDHAVKLPATKPTKGGRRGAMLPGKRVLSGVTTNKGLTVVKLFLSWARRNGLVPHLDGDAVRDRLRPVKVERNAIEILRPKQVVALLRAALRHDAETYAMTRAEHDGDRPAGTTPRYEPAAPFVLALLLSGMRLSELIGLRWAEVDLTADEIRLGSSRTKTGHARIVTLTETPTLAALLGALRLRTPGDRVWPAWTVDLAKATRKRLLGTFAAPAFDWRALRRSCAAVLTNAPGIYGSASAFRSAKRAGHSVVIAERHYVDVLRDLPATATTIEDAIRIRSIAEDIVARVRCGVAAEAIAQ
jgi:integrase